METHKAVVGFISPSQKTAKTECGLTIKTTSIATEADCTCPGCRAVIDRYWQACDDLLSHAEQDGTAPAHLRSDLENMRPQRYRTIYFF